VLRDRQSAP